VLEMTASGETVSAHDALQLRNWAAIPEDAMLPLEELALRILGQEENRKHARHKNPRTLQSMPCEERE